MPTPALRTITLGDLRPALEDLLRLGDDTLVTFGHGDLQFYRLKNRGPVEGPPCINVEFSTLYRVTAQPDDDDAA